MALVGRMNMELKNLLNRQTRIAVLAGAGISLETPSNLMDGWNFMFEVLCRALPSDVDRMLKYSSAELKKNDR